MTQKAPTLVWFRQDLRLHDHPALQWAIEQGGPIVPVYIWSTEEQATGSLGSASKWWLHQSLDALRTSLEQRGSRLIFRSGDPLQELNHLAKETGARQLVWHRLYEPYAVRRDTEIKQWGLAQGWTVHSLNGSLLHEPWEIQTAQGKPFQVFTPFWKACQQKSVQPLARALPKSFKTPVRWPGSVSLSSFKLEPAIDWSAGIKACWQPGEAGAQQLFRAFINGAIERYQEDRNRPDLAGTSRLSPHLHFGEISPRQIVNALLHHAAGQSLHRQKQADAFVRELYWREFAYHLIYHFPHTVHQPLRAHYQSFKWNRNPGHLKAWQRGRTGYPIVDAGMRELWHTGWMHNRVRMIVASFLVKHLRLPWQDGAKWFWDTLVDADLANNTLGWQWTAGCGADAAPYFRIFNPTLQGKKFDPDGHYTRQWVPELAQLPTHFLFEPWSAPEAVLNQAGVKLGQTYPEPLVDHAQARAEALAAFAALPKG